MNLKQNTRRLALAAAIALAASISPAMAADTATEVTEARQEAQIWTSYALSPYLKAHDIKIIVDEGTATLSGTVGEEVDKELAGEIAQGVSGITKVDNQILVAADYVPGPASSERSFGEIVEDASITTAVKSKLLWSKHAQGLSAKVETKAGRVALTGTADSDEARALAEALAQNTRGVVAVDNQLVVDRNQATLTETVKDTGDDVGQDFSDAWITTKVKSTLIYSSNINSSNIAVHTKDGNVTLSGAVNSGAEHALAVQLAGNVKGVRSVDAKGLSHP